MSNHKYDEGYVAYFDILGFSNYVKKVSPDDVDDLSNLFRTVDIIDNLMREASKASIKFLFGSDSFFISVNKDNFLQLLYPLSMLFHHLLMDYGFLIRGGISKGLFYHDNNNLFGPAVVNAVELEHQATKSRICVDPKIEMLDHYPFEVFTDLDGRKCLNVFSQLIWSSIDETADDDAYTDEELFQALTGYLKDTRAQLLDLCDGQCCEAVVEKYLWQFVPFNYTVDYILNNPDDLERFRPGWLNDGRKEELKNLRVNVDRYYFQALNDIN